MTALVAFALVAGLAIAGRLVGWLTTGAAVAATAVGTAVVSGAGIAGAAWLGLFFVSGSLLGDRNRPHQARAPGRTARQVLANGCWAASGGVLLLSGFPAGRAVVGGALAAAMADTWATEIGQHAGGRPRSIVTGRAVLPGTSGGVSLVGTAAGVAGAGAMALAVGAAVGAHPALATWMAGVAGMLADSLLGATLQARYYCATCGRELETPHSEEHQCERIRGAGWFENDAVNAAATGIGALVAALFW